jgi:DNA primase
MIVFSVHIKKDAKMLIENYKILYQKLYSKINLEKIMQYYNIDCKPYHAKNGREFLSCCPFHDDLTPSFSMNEKTGVFNCFVCGGGDFIEFIKKIENLKSTGQAIEFIKSKVGIIDNFDVFSIIENSMQNITIQNNVNIENIEDKVIEFKLPECFPAEQFYDIVKKRVSLENIKKWNMKYCKDDKKFHDRLIIPVYENNKLVTFAARDMSGQSENWSKVKSILKTKKLTKQQRKQFIDKYLYKKILYPFGTPLGKLFFNWDEAIKQKEVIICEGIFDAIRIIDFGYNALALLTCHLNSYKAKKILENFETVYVALDNDDKINLDGTKSNPGQEAAKIIIDQFLSDMQVYNMVLPLGKDPDECSKVEFDKAFLQSKIKDSEFKLFLE